MSNAPDFEAKAREVFRAALHEGDSPSHEPIAAALRQAADEALERAARGCESMVIGGRAWTEEQAIAAKALFAAAEGIRALASPAAAPAAEPSEPVAPAPHNEVRVLVEPCEAGGHYRNDRGVTFHPSPCIAQGKEPRK